jgi:hypothetical protein
LIFSSCEGNALGQYTLPDYKKTVAYVNNLIDSYNELVQNSTFIQRPDFAELKGNFSLYHDAGYSFQVVAMQSAPENPDYVALIFAPIHANQPNVTMDYNDTFTSLTGNVLNATIEVGVFENDLFQAANRALFIPLVLTILTADISGNYEARSSYAARSIYEGDAERVHFAQAFMQTTITIMVPSFITEYLATTTTQTQIGTTTTTSQTNILVTSTQNWYDRPTTILQDIFVFVVGTVIATWIIGRKRKKNSPRKPKTKLEAKLLRRKRLKEEIKSHGSIENNKAQGEKTKP